MMFEKIKHWIRFNLYYLGHPRWDTGVSPPELISYLDTHSPGRALDLGCGTGTNLLSIAKKGWDVAGMDLAFLSVFRARKKLKANDIQARIIIGNAAGKSRIDEQFDFVLDIGCYHNLLQRDRLSYHTNLKNWLSEDGTFLLFAHQRTSNLHSHGVSQEDFSAFGSFLDLEWRRDGHDQSSDGSIRRPSTWVCYRRRI